MILDRLENADRYAALHPGFARGLAFLAEARRLDLPEGRHEVDGDRIYAVVARAAARSRARAALEAHRRYIDIQFVLSGVEEIGWRSRAECNLTREPYDVARDIEFFADPPTAWVTVEPGAFAVFFPEDAHAPLAGSGEVRKIVVKVAVECTSG